MEMLYSAAKGKNGDVFSDPAHRMSKRPLAVKSGEGLGYQDFGSSFGPLKGVANHRNSPNGKSKIASMLHARPRKAPSRISEDESDDELLLSSQNSKGSDATSFTKRATKENKAEVPDDEEIINVDGRVLSAHPDFKPSSYNAIKGLRFTKNKKATPPGNNVVEVPSLTDSQELFKPISGDIGVVNNPRPRDPSSSGQKPSTTRHEGTDVTRVVAGRSADTSKSSTFKPSPLQSNDTPRRPRPRPRVVIKPIPSTRDDSAESTPRPARCGDISPRSKTSEQSTGAGRKPTTKNPPPSRREPQPFPMSLKAKENVSDSDDASSSKVRKAPISRNGTSIHAPRLIPLPSPLKTKPVSRESTFPTLSPLSSPLDKGKARAVTPEDNAGLTDGLEKRTVLRPFPMSSQVLAGIDRRSKSPSTCSHVSTKRASSDDSGTEQGRIAKKHKDSRSAVLDTLDYLHEPMEDSLELGYARDPSTVCPYCDEDLPPHPTPLFQHLLATARKKSISDPRPRNRGGLKAPLTVYISVCQRHRFELHQLPIATEKGWPKTIDFAKVPARVKKMKKVLEAIILDKDDISDVENLGECRGPRNKSVFWREVKKEVKKQGSRTVVGLKGQFASFEKTQPGYYGEQGSVIIHQTLFDLFPPSTFNASLIAPLAPAEFIQRILVPEAGVRLIAQDLGVDISEAVVTLRESAQYGVAMFPDTSEHRRKGGVDDDEMGVADRIVMERARARRKELAEQEKVEDEILEEERAAQRARARERRREKALERAQQARESKARADKANDASEVSESAIRKTRRETGQQVVTDDSESDAMSVDGLTSRRSTRVNKKGARADGGEAARATSRLASSDTDSMEVVGDPGHKARNGKSKTRGQTRDPDTRVGAEAIVTHERKKPFSIFAALDDDGDESTPRPVRKANETAVSRERIPPLQIVRGRSGASAPNLDGWFHNLRTKVPDDSDSDASRSSQRLDRPGIRKGKSGELPWLFDSDSS